MSTNTVIQTASACKKKAQKKAVSWRRAFVFFFCFVLYFRTNLFSSHVFSQSVSSSGCMLQKSHRRQKSWLSWWDQHARELFSVQKMSHKHNNKDRSCLQKLSAGMRVNTRYIKLVHELAGNNPSLCGQTFKRVQLLQGCWNSYNTTLGLLLLIQCWAKAGTILLKAERNWPLDCTHTIWWSELKVFFVFNIFYMGFADAVCIMS